MTVWSQIADLKGPPGERGDAASVGTWSYSTSPDVIVVSGTVTPASPTVLTVPLSLPATGAASLLARVDAQFSPVNNEGYAGRVMVSPVLIRGSVRTGSGSLVSEVFEWTEGFVLDNGFGTAYGQCNVGFSVQASDVPAGSVIRVESWSYRAANMPRARMLRLRATYMFSGEGS